MPNLPEKYLPNATDPQALKDDRTVLQVQSQGLGRDAESKAEITKQIRAISYAIGKKEDKLSKCMAAAGIDPPPPPPRAYTLLTCTGSSVAAVGIEQSRTEQEKRSEQSRFFGLNERDSLTG